MAQRVLLIEDSAAFRKAVSRALGQKGFVVAEAATGKEGLLAAERERPDLIILDLVLPGLRGFEVCQQLKQKRETAAIPVLILTGNDNEGQDISCLDVGADDYLTKPVAADRLLAHVRALLRRADAASAAPESVLSLGPLRLNYERKLVILDGFEHPELTPKEFGLLYELAACSPRPLDRAALYRRVWGLEPPSEASLKTVDVHVRRIRLKLGWSTDVWLSHVAGRGYSLSAP